MYIPIHNGSCDLFDRINYVSKRITLLCFDYVKTTFNRVKTDAKIQTTNASQMLRELRQLRKCTTQFSSLSREITARLFSVLSNYLSYIYITFESTFNKAHFTRNNSTFCTRHALIRQFWKTISPRASWSSLPLHYLVNLLISDSKSCVLLTRR